MNGKTKRKPTTNRRPATNTSASSLVWDYRDELVPRVGTPAADLIAKRQRRIRRYVRFSAVALPFVLVLAFFVILVSFHSAPPITNDSGSASSSPGRTVATLEIQQWLAETPSPLPHATVLSWDGAKDVAPSTGSANGDPTWTAELDSFTLTVPSVNSQTIYDATVEVALKAGGGAVALGGPSLIVVPPTGTVSGWDGGGPWSGLSSSDTVSGPVQGAINGWLSAYVSGSSSRLRLAVGDVHSDGSYLPLTGVSSAKDTVVAAATRVAPNAPVQKKSVSPSAEIVEVNLDIVWNHEKVDPATEGFNGGPSTTMDLLVERANTVAPVVVAWGPPGTGPSLVPYQNAHH